jgi:plasmid stabilization system protein ParE
MSFQVSLTDGASSDVRTILRWIEERSPAGALSWYRAWQKVLQSLHQQADKFGVAPESEDHPETIFQVVFKTRRGRPYRALFILRDSHVFVLHVRGPGQNLLGHGEIRKPS